MTAEDPMTAVAIGTGKFIEFLAGYRRLGKEVRYGKRFIYCLHRISESAEKT